MERTPEEASRDRAACAAAAALRLLLPDGRGARGQELNFQSWQYVPGRQLAALQAYLHKQTPPDRVAQPTSSCVFGSRAPRRTRPARVRARITFTATARTSEGRIAVRRSLYPSADWLRRRWAGKQSGHPALNPRARNPAFLRRGSGHIPWHPEEHSTRNNFRRASTPGTRGSLSANRPGARTPSSAGQVRRVAQTQSPAHLRASKEEQGEAAMLWDSRMASGVYAEGMRDGDGAQGARVNASLQPTMAMRRKSASYLFGGRPPANAGRKGAQSASRTAGLDPGAGRVALHCVVPIRPDSTQDGSGWAHSDAVPSREFILPHSSGGGDMDTDACDGVNAWQVGPSNQGSVASHDGLRAAVDRAAFRNEGAFERLAGIALDGLEQEFRSRTRNEMLRDGIKGSDAGTGVARRSEHGSMVWVPTQAGDCRSVGNAPAGKSVGRGEPSVAALQERAEQAAKRRRHQQWNAQRLQDVQQRWRCHEGGIGQAREVLLAQEILDRVADQGVGACTMSMANRRPCTGAPNVQDVPVLFGLETLAQGPA